MTTPTPDLYKQVFEDDRRGAAILEHLTRMFASKVYVPGGHEADRETCYRAGKRDVVEFIVTQINRASGVQDPNEE